MRTRIEVTAEDIKQGVQDSCDACPVALAIERTVDVEYLRVLTTEVHYGHEPEEPKEVPLPDEARVFIRRFDAGLPVEPFAFDLDVSP